MKNIGQVWKSACLQVIFQKHLIHERSKLWGNYPLLPKCKMAENMLTFEKTL